MKGFFVKLKDFSPGPSIHWPRGRLATKQKLRKLSSFTSIGPMWKSDYKSGGIQWPDLSTSLRSHVVRPPTPSTSLHDERTQSLWTSIPSKTRSGSGTRGWGAHPHLPVSGPIPGLSSTPRHKGWSSGKNQEIEADKSRHQKCFEIRQSKK